MDITSNEHLLMLLIHSLIKSLDFFGNSGLSFCLTQHVYAGPQSLLGINEKFTFLR